MGDLVQFPEKVTTGEYFGGCPTCGKNDGYINVGRDHYFLCHEHKIFWRAASNLFSDWREESEGTWFVNKRVLSSYKEMEPIHPEPTPEEQAQIDRANARREIERKIDRGYGIGYGPTGPYALGPHDNPFDLAT